MEYWGDPEAVYDLPKGKRIKAVAVAMTRQTTPSDQPLTKRLLHEYLIDSGLLKAKSG